MLSSSINKFIRLLGSGLLILLVACDSSAVVSDASVMSSEASSLDQNTEKNVKHTLWKIKGKNNTVYLMGSIHMLPPELYPLPAVYENAYEDAERLVFEVDESILDQEAAQSVVMQYAKLPVGQSLENTIGTEAYAEIKALAKKNKIPMLMIEPFDPWFSGITLVSMQYLNAGLSPQYGIDQHFMQRGLKAGKPVDGLETLEEQFGMFDSISMEIQADMLIDSLSEETNVKEFIDKMIAKWQAGDMQALGELLQADFEEYQEMYDILLVNRNKNWIPQIIPMLSETDDYLVVVGAAHMLGEQGVVGLLEAEGYKVEQL